MRAGDSVLVSGARTQPAPDLRVDERPGGAREQDFPVSEVRCTPNGHVNGVTVASRGKRVNLIAEHDTDRPRFEIGRTGGGGEFDESAGEALNIRAQNASLYPQLLGETEQRAQGGARPDHCVDALAPDVAHKLLRRLD